MLNIASNFKLSSKPVSYEVYGCGHINVTYLVKCEDDTKYILQKINHNTFKDVEGLMNNIEYVTEYVKENAKNTSKNEADLLEVIRTLDNKLYYQDETGYYRVYNFLRGETVDSGATLAQFELAGKGFGEFQKSLDGFDATKLVESIPNFHNTVDRFNKFLEAVKLDPKGRAESVKDEIKFYKDRVEYASRVLNLIASGEIPLRTTHNDTKPNNLLVLEKENYIVAVIDLDTIMPGSILYDFGDSIRYGTNTGKEDEVDLSKVTFSIDYFEAYTKGFVPVVKDVLTKAEKENLYFAGILMTYECGMRFLTDYLMGDTYFRTTHPTHNLERCHTQMKMVLEMEKYTNEMKAVINKYL